MGGVGSTPLRDVYLFIYVIMLFSTGLEMAQTGTEYERFVKQSHETAI